MQRACSYGSGSGAVDLPVLNGIKNLDLRTDQPDPTKELSEFIQAAVIKIDVWASLDS